MFLGQIFRKSLVLSCFFMFFLCFGSVFAESDALYYADIVIDVQENGLVTISGPTNYQNFIGVVNSQDLTSKTGANWILNVSSVESFETFIYELKLPKYSQISYIKTTPTFRISNKGDKIVIIGTGTRKPFTLLIQYEVDYDAYSFFMNNSRLFFFLSLITLIFFSIIVTYIITKRVIETKKIRGELKDIEEEKTRDAGNVQSNVRMVKHSKIEENSSNEERKMDSGVGVRVDEVVDVVEVASMSPEYDYDILPQRQKDIIDILGKKGKITQKELENDMQIPKSSISRNVRTLEIKGIVKKESVGQTNYLSLVK